MAGDRHFDAQGIDGLHDRRRHGSDRDRDRALLLPAISDDRFHDDIRGVLAGSGDCDRMDIAEAVAGLHHCWGIGTGRDHRCGPALAPLSFQRELADIGV